MNPGQSVRVYFSGSLTINNVIHRQEYEEMGGAGQVKQWLVDEGLIRDELSDEVVARLVVRIEHETEAHDQEVADLVASRERLRAVAKAAEHCQDTASNTFAHGPADRMLAARILARALAALTNADLEAL